MVTSGMDQAGMTIFTFIVLLCTRINFGNNMSEGTLKSGSDCSSQAAGLPCVASRMEGPECAMLPMKSPNLYAGLWHVDGPSEIKTEHFCKADNDGNNMPGLNIRWKLPDHSGMRDLKGFEIMIEGAAEICIVEDLSNANITRSLFLYGEIEFEQTVYPIEVGSLYIITIHSLPKKINSNSRTHFSSSISCKDASAATWVARLKIIKDFMNRTILVTFDPPPLIYDFTKFTYLLKRQRGNDVRIEERDLNSNYCIFGNLTSTEKYEVMVKPYDPFWNDRGRCKCKNIAKVCDTCIWTRTGTFTFNTSRVRQINVSEQATESTTTRHDNKTDAIIISAVIPVSVLIAIILFIVWKKGDKDSDTKKYIGLVVNGEMENQICLLSSLQDLIQSTGRCITWILNCSFSCLLQMIDVKKYDCIVLVTVPTCTKTVTDDMKFTEAGYTFFECLELAHAKTSKAKAFREKLVRISFHDISSGLTQSSSVRYFQLPNELVPFLVDIGCFQAGVTNNLNLEKQLCDNRDLKMAFDTFVATCQTVIGKNHLENTNSPSKERCECKMVCKDYQDKIEMEIRSSSRPRDKDGTKLDDVEAIYRPDINDTEKDLSQNVSFWAHQSPNRLQHLEDLKKTICNDDSCHCPTHEQMLKLPLPVSRRNDTRVIRKKFDHDIRFGVSLANQKRELKQQKSTTFDDQIMDKIVYQKNLKDLWDCQNSEDDWITDENTVPDSGFFECISLVEAQFLGVSDINVADIDETEQEEIISRDMDLINGRYDNVIKQLGKGETVSLSGNSV